MFILTNVYPALVIKMFQMDGREEERVMMFLTSQLPLCAASANSCILQLSSLVLCTLMPASQNYLPSDFIRVGFALCYQQI